MPRAAAWLPKCLAFLACWTLQESCLKNVKEVAKARAVLASYHPLWLRLGMEVVVGKPVAGQRAGLWACGWRRGGGSADASMCMAAGICACIAWRCTVTNTPRPSTCMRMGIRLAPAAAIRTFAAHFVERKACGCASVVPAGDDVAIAAPDLAAFVREQFLKDPQLAKLHPASSKAYWVRTLLAAFLPAVFGQSPC